MSSDANGIWCIRWSDLSDQLKVGLRLDRRGIDFQRGKERRKLVSGLAAFLFRVHERFRFDEPAKSFNMDKFHRQSEG